MNKLDKQYTDLFADAYKNYLDKRTSANKDNINEPHTLANGMVGKVYTQEEFINKIKTDDEFAKEWGITIETRDLSLEERKTILKKNKQSAIELAIAETSPFEMDGEKIPKSEVIGMVFKTHKIPTRLNSITYNNETIESYE